MTATATKNEPPVKDGIATMKDAMAFLRRSRSHVERLISADKIDAVKDGRIWAIDWDSLYAYKAALFKGKRRKAS